MSLACGKAFDFFEMKLWAGVLFNSVGYPTYRIQMSHHSFQMSFHLEAYIILVGGHKTMSKPWITVHSANMLNTFWQNVRYHLAIC